MVGHSYIVYAPLLYGCTTVLFEGKPVGTPDAGAYWRLIAEHGVSAMFTAPTAFRAIKRDDPDGELHPQIRSLEIPHAVPRRRARRSADRRMGASSSCKMPVIDHWWQTETGWAIAANCVGLEPLPVKHGSSTKPVPGYDLRVLDADGHEMKRGEIGALCVKLPLPPGCVADLVERRRALRARPISPIIPATTTPPMPAISTRTAMSS